MTRSSRQASAGRGVPGAAPAAFGALDRARRCGVAGMRAILLWQMLRTALRLCFAGAMAILAGRMIAAGVVDPAALAAVLVALPLAGLAGLMAARRQAAAEADVARRLRAAASDALAAMPALHVLTRPAGALLAGLQRHPEALASLVTGHRAAAAMLAIGPLFAAAAIVVVSWEAAAGLTLATPVMIVFFILVGETIRTLTQKRERDFGRLAAQFADRIRTLPTILAGHALRREQAKLESRMGAYAASTLGVLRIAFLNAGVIDFFSSLSIAILAVFLGLGHLKLVAVPGFSDLALWQSLFILMIAPEYFAPFRRYAELYHAKGEGLAAAGAMDLYLGADQAAGAERPVRSGRLHPPHAGLVAVVGASGSGKSTLLRQLAGVEPATDAAAMTGGLAETGIAWLSTDIYIPEGTLGEAIGWGSARACRTRLMLAARRVGLLDDRLLPGGLDGHVTEGGENLSGGQRLRIGVARMLLSPRPVIADEPTAKLDPATAGAVRRALADIARRRLVVVATHDEALAGPAELTVNMETSTAPRREAAA